MAVDKTEKWWNRVMEQRDEFFFFFPLYFLKAHTHALQYTSDHHHYHRRDVLIESNQDN